MGNRANRKGPTRREKKQLAELRKIKERGGKITESENILLKRFDAMRSKVVKKKEVEPETLGINVSDGVKTAEKVG